MEPVLLSSGRYQAFADQPADPVPARDRSIAKTLLVFAGIIGFALAATVGLPALKTVAVFGGASVLIFLFLKGIASMTPAERTSWRWTSNYEPSYSYGGGLHQSDRPAAGGRGSGRPAAPGGQGRGFAQVGPGRQPPAASGGSGYAPVGPSRQPPSNSGGNSNSGFAPVGQRR